MWGSGAVVSVGDFGHVREADGDGPGRLLVEEAYGADLAGRGFFGLEDLALAEARMDDVVAGLEQNFLGSGCGRPGRRGRRGEGLCGAFELEFVGGELVEES